MTRFAIMRGNIEQFEPPFSKANIRPEGQRGAPVPARDSNRTGQALVLEAEPPPPCDAEGRTPPPITGTLGGRWNAPFKLRLIGRLYKIAVVK